MKKLLALLLLLAMLLPAAAMADTLHMDPFTFELPEEDLYIQYEKSENGVLLFIYPAPDWGADFHDNINVTWTTDLLLGVEQTADELAAETLDDAIAQLEEADVAVDRPEILDAALDPVEGTFSIYYRMDVDYTAVGVDMQIALYFYQQSISIEGDGTYIFTLTSDSEEGIDGLRAHLDEVMTR